MSRFKRGYFKKRVQSLAFAVQANDRFARMKLEALLSGSGMNSERRCLNLETQPTWHTASGFTGGKPI